MNQDVSDRPNRLMNSAKPDCQGTRPTWVSAFFTRRIHRAQIRFVASRCLAIGQRTLQQKAEGAYAVIRREMVKSADAYRVEPLQ